MARPRLNRQDHDTIETNDIWENSNPEVALEASRRGISEQRYLFDNDTSYKGTLYFPPQLVPDGYQYGFVNERLMNEDQHENILEKCRMGWEFVPASDHPEYALPQIKHRFAAGLDDGNIRIKGSVLMKIRKELADAHLRKCEQEADSIRRQSLALTDYLNGGPNRFTHEMMNTYSPMRVRSTTNQ